MIARFCTYALLRNLRFFEPFFFLYLLLDVQLSFLATGAVLAYGKLLEGALEIPLSVINDRYGRRWTLAASFGVAAAAFGLLGTASQVSAPLPWLYGGQTLLAVGEALRTGTHKAMMLDWLTHQGRRGESTQIIGLQRFWSKTSEGLSALLGGLTVWLTGSFTVLFFAAIVPSLATGALVMSYPKTLEGELHQKAKTGETEAWGKRLLKLFAHPGTMPLVLASVLFESQVELALVYLQPLLAGALSGVQLEVVGGVGALLFGSWAFLQGMAAGTAALFSGRWVAKVGARRALLHASGGAAVLVAGVTLGLRLSLPFVGVLALAALAALQNLRRPVFVADLDQVMDPAFRTTTLSIENQARAWLFAGSTVVVGALADEAGLFAAFLWMTALLLGSTALMGLKRLKKV